MICLTSTLSMYIFTLPISELDDADTDIVTLPVTVEPAAGFVIETNGDAVTTLLMLIVICDEAELPDISNAFTNTVCAPFDIFVVSRVNVYGVVEVSRSEERRVGND